MISNRILFYTYLPAIIGFELYALLLKEIQKINTSQKNNISQINDIYPLW